MIASETSTPRASNEGRRSGERACVRARDRARGRRRARRGTRAARRGGRAGRGSDATAGPGREQRLRRACPPTRCRRRRASPPSRGGRGASRGSGRPSEPPAFAYAASAPGSSPDGRSLIAQTSRSNCGPSSATVRPTIACDVREARERRVQAADERDALVVAALAVEEAGLLERARRELRELLREAQLLRREGEAAAARHREEAEDVRRPRGAAAHMRRRRDRLRAGLVLERGAVRRRGSGARSSSDVERASAPERGRSPLVERARA